MYINRFLDINQLVEKKSYFLFGPRATEKSSPIKHQLSENAQIINLLHSKTRLRLLEKPSLLEAMLDATGEHQTVVIDEIQLIPELLNEVHRLIEDRKITFLLTSSSARKLKHQSVNLLAGRARQAELFPLTYQELSNFNLPH